jgi:hypothetical protein
MEFNNSIQDNRLLSIETIKTREIKGMISKAIKERKERSDKGAKRLSYNDNLPKRYRGYLNRANKKGLEFNLSIEEFDAIIASDCVYCGGYSRITIDRKDSRDGYTIENSQPCCFFCNMMKFTHSEDEFIKHIFKIQKYLANKQI